MMSDMRITGAGAGQDFQQIRPKAKDAAGGFEDIMQDAIGKISQIQSETDNAVKELASGGDVTQAIVSMEKADMSFQLMLEVRNKLLNAYEEIMRMQV
jgi:flagellar hook-basal body complex protein FliE